MADYREHEPLKLDAQVGEKGEDALAHLSSGCVTIVGSPINLNVCYTYDPTTETVCVTVALAGHTMGQTCLSAEKTDWSVCLSLAVVKACVGLQWKDNCLNFTATACYYVLFSGWHCTNYRGTIFCA